MPRKQMSRPENVAIPSVNLCFACLFRYCVYAEKLIKISNKLIKITPSIQILDILESLRNISQPSVPDINLLSAILLR